ncbi:MAG: tRNA lysidine(34) synthetase TilS [Defluviitaleaceae bacterium]|nr:tRNA lysidine(34) synthetase TilS [Defluviitaleaceae bacterium]
MLKKVMATITEYSMLARGDGIVIGLSGGADSVAMTHFLHNCLTELELRIVCVHVHHGLRGEEADSDLEFCQEFCENLGIELIIVRYNVAVEANKRNIGIEEAGRILRYECFNQALQELRYNKIAVAHNQDDMAETVIMNTTRGAGGIRGIPPINGNIIRPLINVSRKKILEYCGHYRISYRTDSTNESNNYTRNWVRNFLLPQMRDNLNPHINLALSRLATISADEDGLISNIAKQAYEKCVKYSKNNQDGLIIDLGQFVTHDIAIKRRIIRMVIEEMLGNTKNITYEHVKSILALTSLQSGKQIPLLDGYMAEKSYNEICIKKPSANDGFSLDLAKNIPIYVSQINRWICLSENIIKENAFTKAINCDRITDGSLQIRTRLSGDRIFFNNVGTKKIKDFFTDKKIRRDGREQAVFIAYGQDVILIFNINGDNDKPIESHKFNPSENDSNTIFLQIWKK